MIEIVWFSVSMVSGVFLCVCFSSLLFLLLVVGLGFIILLMLSGCDSSVVSWFVVMLLVMFRFLW